MLAKRQRKQWKRILKLQRRRRELQRNLPREILNTIGSLVRQLEVRWRRPSVVIGRSKVGRKGTMIGSMPGQSTRMSTRDHDFRKWITSQSRILKSSLLNALKKK